MLRVGLTGGIGSGKSTVARRLVDLGAALIDSDVLAREVVAPGTEGLAAIRARFGDGVLAADGTLDRPALGQVVFGDDAARNDLNAIIHPAVLSETQRRMAQLDEAGEAIVIHDIPLLVELGRAPDYHVAVVVGASEATRLHRLIHDRGMTERDAMARMAAQATDAQRRQAADVWLDNDGTIDALLAGVDRLWHRRLEPFAARLRSGMAPGESDVQAQSEAAMNGAAPRLVARIERALRQAHVAIVSTDADASAPEGLRLDVTLAGAAEGSSQDLESAMARAGFVKAARRATTATDGESTFENADPARPATAYVRRAH